WADPWAPYFVTRKGHDRVLVAARLQPDFDFSLAVDAETPTDTEETLLCSGQEGTTANCRASCCVQGCKRPRGDGIWSHDVTHDSGAGYAVAVGGDEDRGWEEMLTDAAGNLA
ncbi:unnamed protein product, partial [Amoebophrya sp. A120]